MSIKNKISSFVKKVVYREEDKLLNKRLDIISFDNISNPKKIKKADLIIFVIPTIKKGMGGITSILRIGTGLENLGKKVYYAVYKEYIKKELYEAAEYNLESFKGDIISYKEAKEIDSDIVIASDWLSVYYTKTMKGYKMYFVQDFEPYMYPISDNYFLAKKTYEFGSHIVSLGSWNIRQIQKNCNIDNVLMNYVTFPFEHNEYQYVEKNLDAYTSKKEFNIAVYVKREKKRAPGLIMSMCKKIEEYYNSNNIKINFKFFGLNKNEKVSTGINLGKLSKRELCDLYYNCDFGLVASLTNISLVPYEMIGTGLPVFEFVEGSYIDFLGKNTAILIDFDYHSFIDKLNYYLLNIEELKKVYNNAYGAIKGLSWNETCLEFNSILNSLIEK